MKDRKHLTKQTILLYEDNPDLFNKLVVTAFVNNNNLTIINREIKEHLLTPDQVKEENDIFEYVRNLEDVIELFELLIPKSHRVINGAVYTPKYIREYIIDSTFGQYKGDLITGNFADIACGCGAFLITMADYLVNKFNINYADAYSKLWGIDVDKKSIERARILISLHSALHGEVIDTSCLHLIISNTLGYDFNGQKFDIIVGNPPYVRAKHIDAESKRLMKKWDVCKSGNSDLYIPFFQIGLSLLRKNGKLGYITVNSFFKSVNARTLRDYLSLGLYNISILNFGEELIFKGKLAYTCLFFADKIHSSSLKYSKVQSKEIKNSIPISTNLIPFSDLDNKKGWNLNNSKIMETIEKLESTGVPLGKTFPIKNGIATLANDIFIFQPFSEDQIYYYIKLDGFEIQKIEKDICRDIIKPNILKHENEIKDKKEKLIFPYDKEGKLLPEEILLNSFPFAYNYLNLHREILLERDKGQGKYPWYAFGRSQAITNKGIKLLFPYMTDVPHFVFTEDEDMLIYCGYGIYSSSERELKVLKRILESEIFNFYMRHTAKPYSTGYYSYAKNYVKGFGIVELSEDEKDAVLQMNSFEINDFLCEKYEINSELLSI